MTDSHAVPDEGDGIVIMADSQRSWPMIGQILADWSEWRDVEPVGFSIVAGVAAGSRFVIVVLWRVTAALLWRVVAGAVAGRRRLAPLSTRAPWPRLALGLAGLALVAVVPWDTAQEYSFFSSILPTTLGWCRAAVVALGSTLLMTALVAVTREADHPTEPLEPRGSATNAESMSSTSVR